MLLTAVGFLVAAAVLRDALRLLYAATVTQFSNEMMVRSRERLLERISAAETDSRRARVDGPYVLNSDVPQLASLYALPLTTVVSDVIDTLMMTVAIALISPLLAVIVCLPLAPVYWISRAAGRKQRRLAEAVRDQEVRLAEIADDLVNAWITIRVFGGMGREAARASKSVASMRRSLSSANLNLAALMGKVSAIRIATTGIVMALCALGVSNGIIGVGSVATLLLYLNTYYYPAINLSKTYQAVQRGSLAAGKIIEALRPGGDPEPPQGAGATWVPNGLAHVACRRFQWRLPDGRGASIDDFSQLGPGLVLLRGESGVGKSTLLRWLAGVERLDVSGGIRLESGPMVSGALAGVEVSYAGQEEGLVGDSVLDAVAYPHGLQSWDDGTLHEGLSALGLEEVRGRSLAGGSLELSGGELRRIVLARALARPSSILVADEVTSNLDEKSLALVESALIAASQERLVIAAVHSPSSRLVTHADHVATVVTVVPDRGGTT